MKKLSLALVIVVALALSAACSKKSDPAPTEPTPAQPAPEQPAAPADQPGGTQAAAPTAAGDAKSYRYVLEASGPGTPKMRFEYLVVPPKMNVRMITEQGKVNIISDGQNYWMVQDEAKMAMKMPAEAKPEIPDNMIFAPLWSEFKQKKTEGGNIEEQGKANINGKDTTKYLIKDPTGKGVMTVYVDAEDVVRRIEVVQEGQTEPFIMDVIELQLNPSTTDADFAPPAGYTIQEIPSMPGAPKP